MLATGPRLLRQTSLAASTPCSLRAASIFANSFLVLVDERLRNRIRSTQMAKPRIKQRITADIKPTPPSMNFCLMAWCALVPSMASSATSSAAGAACSTAVVSVVAADSSSCALTQLIDATPSIIVTTNNVSNFFIIFLFLLLQFCLLVMLIKINSLFLICGERGIRTHDTISHGIHTFQACAFDHSAISPSPQMGRTKRSAKYKKNQTQTMAVSFFIFYQLFGQSGDGKRLKGPSLLLY